MHQQRSWTAAVVATALALGASACTSQRSESDDVSGGDRAAAPTDGPSDVTATARVADEDVADSEPPRGDPPATSAPSVGPIAPATDATASDPADPPDTTAPLASAGFEPELEERACPGAASPEASCHWVAVPADWGAPAAATIRLPVTVIAASPDGGRSAVPRRPDPIVIPAGGPGFDNSQDYGWTGAPQNDARDIVLYDQRGTGLAEPDLDCPERDATWVAVLQAADPYERESTAIIDTMAACRERLERDGVDLDDYDTEASVRDLDAIRRVLGYDEWNILGISYGARLALASMRSAPDGIRSVILDSVADVTTGVTASTLAAAQRASDALVVACNTDPACVEAYGDLEAVIDGLYDAWEAEPAVVEVDLDDGAGPRTFRVTGSDLLAGLFNAMYDADLVPLLPSVVHSFAEGQTAVLAELIRAGVGQGTGQADAMNWSVSCADVGAVDAAADATAQADPGRQGTLVSTLPYCADWPVESTSPTFNEPVTSDIPAIVLAGAFDPVTPPAASQAAAEHLGAPFAVFPDAAHSVTRFGRACVEAIQLAFLDDPALPPDLSCIEEIPTVSFVPPAG